MNLNIIKDNIIDLSVNVDAIVNSANPFMSKGGGVVLALDNNIKRIAFPLLGAGHHGYTEEMTINCAKKAFEKVTADIKIYIVKPKVNNL